MALEKLPVSSASSFVVPVEIQNKIRQLKTYSYTEPSRTGLAFMRDLLSSEWISKLMNATLLFFLQQEFATGRQN